jgi:hypothetical protein
MPRHPGRPVPNPADFSPFTERPKFDLPDNMWPFPITFYAAMTHGLLARLERLRPREKWLRVEFSNLAAQFTSTARTQGDAVAFRDLVNRVYTARPPRSNSPTCNPLLLLEHYELAQHTLKGVDLSRVRSVDRRAESIRNAVIHLYTQLTAGQEWEGLILPNLIRYTCACKTDLPHDLEAWLQKKRTKRDLIEYLLAHHHGLTAHSVRNLLDEGGRILQTIPRHRF